MAPSPLPARLAAAAVLAVAVNVSTADAQSVLVDEGTFDVRFDGIAGGTETFTIRRSGMGTQGLFLAHGVAELRRSGDAFEVRPVLQARATDGGATEYQVSVSGSDSFSGRVALAGPRFVSRFESPGGTEEREFSARPGTFIVDRDLAHPYFFLHDARPGSVVQLIEPRDRRAVRLSVVAVTDDTVAVGANTVPARRVVFGEGREERRVWYDAQGRVLRVVIPSQGYEAVRRDLPG